MLLKIQSAVSLVTCGCLVSLAASPSSIGFVVTNGQVMVDGATVQRNSTLFQGSLVQAANVSSDLMLPSGANLLLQPGSSANIYRDYAVLRQGTATERGGRGYAVVANGLRVSSVSAGGAVSIGLLDGSHLHVSTQGGAAEVHNGAGVLVARLEADHALSFSVQDPAQTAPAPPATTPATPPATATPGLPQPGQQVTLHGIVRKDHAGTYGHYLLTDVASRNTYELQGSGLDDLVGGSVEVSGTILGTQPAPGADRVLSVFDIHQMTMSEITGNQEPASPAPSAEAPAAAPPSPAESTAPANGAPEVSTQPGASPVPDDTAGVPQPAPLPRNSDTTKVIVIVALAAGAAVGVALGLAGGKSSTVSPE